MNPQDFFAQLPRGKEDKPMLLNLAPAEYSRTDIDGLYYMLDRDFSGCLILPFSKDMNPEVKGIASIDGRQLPPCVVKQMPLMYNLWVLGVPVRGFVHEYGRTYTLHVEGFTDTDGNVMEPQDIPVKCSDRVLPAPEHAQQEAVALQAAQDGIVLLKNEDQVLPLAANAALNLFGKAVHEFRTSAVGAGKINPRYTVDLLEAIDEHSEFTVNEELVEFYRCDKDLIPGEDVLERARALSDTAICILTRGTGENMDNSTRRGEFYLTEDEDALLRTLCERFPKVIVILNVGYPIDVRWAEDYGVKALLYTGFGGMFGGQAVVDVLNGTVNPSGHLPDSWPRDYYDLPASANFYNSVDKPVLNTECSTYLDTVYEEGLYVGYRFYTTFGEKFGKTPAYPFGFGLGYTDFEIQMTESRFDGEKLTVEAKVQNTGRSAGRQTVQIYLHKPGCEDLETPERELIAFEKTPLLEPGEEVRMTLTAGVEQLAVFDTGKPAWVLPAGEYTIFAGADSTAPEAGRFVVESERIIKPVEHLMRAANPPQEMTQKEGMWPAGKRSGVRSDLTAYECTARSHRIPEFQKKLSSLQTIHEKSANENVINANVTNESGSNGKVSFADVKKDSALAPAFVAQMSTEELARLSVCASAGWGMEGVGEAGRVFRVEGYDLPEFPVSDGNSGVNLRIANIGMPSTVTMTAAFDKELMERIGRTIGEEAKALGMPLILAPGMNLHRNPLNGRQPEYFSEDPLLVGTMAGLYCRGMESCGVGSCMKHLAANNCESSRKRNMSIIGERTLRELYLRPFEIAMSIHQPASVMTGYNGCNGQPTSTDEDLLQGFLRQELHFDGITMTDWGSYDTADVVEMARAGICWITPGSMDDTYTKPIVQAVEERRLEKERLQENAVYLIRTLARFA